MQTYSLGVLASGKSRRNRMVMPPIVDSKGAQTEYLRALRAMLSSLAASVKTDVLPAVENEIARHQSSLTRDAWGETIFQFLKDLSVALGIVAEGIVGRILMTEANRHTEKWKASVRATFGIDISAVVAQEDLREFMETAASRNAGLIKSLASDTVSKIERASYDAILQGKTAKQLRTELTQRFGVADKRAKLIARDQTAKLTSDLNRIRHQQAGIADYIWSTSHDERVRPRHKKLEGQEYAYGKPTGAEDGLPPGQPIQCRCVARAIVYFGGERFT